MKLLASIEDYLNFLRHEQGAAKSTYKCYHAFLHHFHTWLTANGYPDPDLSDFNATTVRRFFYHISSKGLRPRSIYGYMIPLRSFGAFLVNHKVLTENPGECVQLPKKDAPNRTEASEDEINLLLECVDRQRNRDHAIFQKAVLATFVYTGVRRAELCDLKLSDVDLKTGWLLVRMGKGSKSRKVPLCNEVKDALAAWLAIRDAQHDYLFAVSKTRRLYFNGVHSVMEEVKHLAGLGDRSDLTPHTLRHACASRLMRNGASLFDVMTWLGHAQIATTQRYLHVNEQQLQKNAHLASLKPQKPKEDDGKVIDLRERQQDRDRTRRRIAR